MYQKIDYSTWPLKAGMNKCLRENILNEISSKYFQQKFFLGKTHLSVTLAATAQIGGNNGGRTVTYVVIALSKQIMSFWPIFSLQAV